MPGLRVVGFSAERTTGVEAGRLQPAVARPQGHECTRGYILANLSQRCHSAITPLKSSIFILAPCVRTPANVTHPMEEMLCFHSPD
jgi:hypothetical protein